ncbi:hypothetical protein FGADI_12634 [Fusarium gaditjirri]|uniref:Uncharacterized protein n=1 Tax=Fusarium gaditjirri TaxID=282569 RepID=A0A8H4SS35_9HYPO|nr:hypothetical protein FGADI_12634 [Fusarium gaditjirri]
MIRRPSTRFGMIPHDRFISLMRMFDENKQPKHDDKLTFPEYIGQYCDYSHTKHTQAGVHRMSRQESRDLDTQREMGVLINKVWTHHIKDPNHLAQYCAFKSIRELSSYVDVIDIHIFDPVRVLGTYHGDKKVRGLTDNVAKLCTKPTLIPVLNKTVSIPGPPGNISPCAFILAHAVQILLFPPQDWNSDRVYSRDQGAYAHRFPTPETIGGGTTPTVAGLFSMEDLHRAVLLFSHLTKRRTAWKWIRKTAPPSSSNAKFPGYHRPASPATDHDQPEATTEPLSNEEPSNSMASPQIDQRMASVDEDAPEELTGPQLIKGLDTIKINTMLVELTTTTRPRQTIAERQQELHSPEMHPLLELKLNHIVDCAKTIHAQPDFDKLLARSRETETRVTFSLEGPDSSSFMRHQLDSRSGAGELSPTIIIEECEFPDGTPISFSVVGINPKVSEEALLACFDWRNNSVIKSNEPYFPGSLGNAKSLINRLNDPTVPKSQIEDHANLDVSAMVEAYDSVYEDESCGVNLFYQQNILDSGVTELGSRDVKVNWLLHQSPIMTRVLDLAITYCKRNKERLLVYVEDPWIQCLLVGLFVTAGFDIATTRTSDGAVETNRIIREWKNQDSGLEIFVANIHTKVMDVDMQKYCSKALILDWPLEPQRLLRTINHMAKHRLGSKEEAMVHMLKLRWSHHDETERICCTKWAMQLSKDINLPDWMTGAVREVCIFEMIKTAWHQEFNRYAWVVMRDNGRRDYNGASMTHHDGIAPRLGHVFSIAAKLILNFPEDKEFWFDSEEVLVAGCYRFLEVIDADFDKGAADRLKVKLSYSPERLRESCLLAFEHSMYFTYHQFKHEYVYGDDYHERNEQLRLGVEARARGEVSVWSDDEAEAEADGDEETEQFDETGTKRKGGDHGEGGAKKQKTGAGSVKHAGCDLDGADEK